MTPRRTPTAGAGHMCLRALASGPDIGLVGCPLDERLLAIIGARLPTTFVASRLDGPAREALDRMAHMLAGLILDPGAPNSVGTIEAARAQVERCARGEWPQVNIGTARHPVLATTLRAPAAWGAWALSRTSNNEVWSVFSNLAESLEEATGPRGAPEWRWERARRAIAKHGVTILAAHIPARRPDA